MYTPIHLFTLSPTPKQINKKGGKGKGKGKGKGESDLWHTRHSAFNVRSSVPPCRARPSVQKLISRQPNPRTPPPPAFRFYIEGYIFICTMCVCFVCVCQQSSAD